MQNIRGKDKINNTIIIQDASIQASHKKSNFNNESMPRDYITIPENPQHSGKEERFLLNHNIHSNKSFSGSSDRTFSNKQLNRNLGDHILLKNFEYSERKKGFCITQQCSVSCSNREKNILTTPEDEHFLSHKQLLSDERHEEKTRNCNIFKNKTKNITENYLTSNDKFHEDKSTFCRPVLSYYNQQFIYKTMQRNARLKNLVKKLSIARQREKEKVTWNNYINDLKNKHRYSQENMLLDHEEYLPDVIDDCCNSTHSWEKSRFCRNLLQDFYGPYNTLQPKMLHGYYPMASQNSKYLKLDTDSLCYPTSAMGRFMMLRRHQRTGNMMRSQGQIQSNEHKKISSNNRSSDALSHRPCLCSPNVNHNEKNLKSSLVQVDNQSCPQFIVKDKGTSKRQDLVKEVSIETNNDYEYKFLNNENIKNKSLVNIENKLEYLIENFNNFISQVKSCKDQDKYKSVSCKNNEKEYKTPKPKAKDSLCLKRNEGVDICGPAINSSESTLTMSDISSNIARYNKINEILKEDINNKQDSIKNNVNNSRSVQISIEVPTKDCCVSVANSLSKSGCGDESVLLDEMITREVKRVNPLQRMTIAVNTDPLSFLALLRFSSDTLKRLLSYMPNFDYLSYLSSLHLTHTTRSTNPHYVCKICGADFNSPSKLSDHIGGHDNFYKTRDCCVCRHVIERTRSGLFTCQYCGLQFTRAYCCELHQHSCAKRLGKCHDVSSSLMLLR